MNALFRFLVQYEFLIYLILAVGAVFSSRLLWKAWADWRSAVFGLEKELTFQQVRVWGASLILFIMIALSQFCVVTFIVPFLPATTFLATPTVDLLQTPGTTLVAGTQMVIGTGTPAAPPGTIGCIPGQLIITSPKPGDQVRERIILSGKVNIPNFGFYKYEFAPQGSEQWSTIAAGNKIVPEDPAQPEGELGVWDTSQLTPGDYQLRLVATDNQGNFLPPCIVPVRVVAP